MLGESLQTPPSSSDSEVSAGSTDGRVPGHRPVPLENFLTTKQVAERLGMTTASVHTRIKEGRLHPIKRRIHTPGTGRKHILAFNPDEVENEIARMHEAFKSRPFVANRIGKGGPIPKKLKTQAPAAAPTAKAAPPKPKAEPKPTPIPAPSTPPPPVEIKSAEESEGERCARAARLFIEGKQQLDVVVEMKITFERARYYWESYQLAQPGWFLTTKVLSRIRALIGWSEEPPTPEGFERALIAHVARQIERAPESEGEPGLDLSDEDRAQLAELERELAGKKPGKPSSDLVGKPPGDPVGKPPAAKPPAEPVGKPPAEPVGKPPGDLVDKPPAIPPSPALSALATMTGLDLSKLNAPSSPEVK